MIELKKHDIPVYATGTSNHKVNDYILTIENNFDFRKSFSIYIDNILNNKSLLKAMKTDIIFYINNYSDNFIIKGNKVISLNIVDYLHKILIRNFLKSIYQNEKDYILNQLSRYIYKNLSDFKL